VRKRNIRSENKPREAYPGFRQPVPEQRVLAKGRDAARRTKAGVITVVIDKPYLRVGDNGRGVDPSVEATLFEPFVTAKGRGKGRGLGLFISAQLLESEGCSLGVLPSRNRYGRLYNFQMDLTGVIQDG